jgi:beta-N-acetylhexosaminidase
VLLVLATTAACSAGGPAPAPPSTTVPAPAPTSTAPSPTTAAPRPEPTTSVDPAAAQVDAALARLDERHKVAQLLVVGLPPDDLDDGAALVEGGVGGIFLEGRPPDSVGQLAARTAGWVADAGAGPRPWVAVDQEGGRVLSLRGPGFPATPSAVDQGRLTGPVLASEVAALASALRQAGVDLDLAPVVDVVPAGTEQANAPIGHWGRQYGSTPAEVDRAASIVLDVLRANQVQPTVKHFPGLGQVTANTDTTGPVTDSVTAPDGPQIGVYRDLLTGSSPPFVMVSSATYTLIDPAGPAMYSPTVVQGLLRGTLGYQGVVISDDVGRAVAAIQGRTPGRRAVDFIRAGGTLVLTDVATDVEPMVDAVLAEAKDPVFAAQLDRAVRTALLAKARAGKLGTAAGQ